MESEQVDTLDAEVRALNQEIKNANLTWFGYVTNIFNGKERKLRKKTKELEH